MRRFTTLAAIMAAAMALAGLFAGSASAGTVLCAKTENPCAQSNIRAAGAEFRAGSLGSPGFKVGTLTCSNNVLTARSTMRNGNPLPAEFEGWVKASSCEIATAAEGTTSCSSVTTNSPPTSFRSTGATSGAVDIGSSAQPLTVSFSCSSNLGPATCSYQATGTVTMEVTDWEKANINAQLSKVSGSNFFVCGGSTASFVVNDVTSEANWISQATETVLCDAQYGEYAVCPNSKIRPAGTTLAAGPVLFGDYVRVGSFECTSGSLTFKTSQQSGAPLPATTLNSLNRSSCTPPDSSGSCSTATISSPGATIESTGSQKGTIRIGSASQPLTFSFTCTGFGLTETCSFSANGAVSLEVDGATRIGTIKATQLSRTAGSWFYCGGNNLNLEAKIRVDEEDTINVV